MPKNPTPSWPTLNCAGCGSAFQRKPGEALTAKYCSRRCMYDTLRADPIARFWTHINKHGPDDCWDWRGSGNQFGHGMFNITHSERMYAHRYSWQLVNGPIPEGGWILHLCDRPPCCNPAHLMLGDHSLNTQHTVERDRTTKGETNGGGKLTAENVIEIRQMIAHAGLSARTIGKQFGVSESQVLRIKRRESWAHI